MANVGVLRRRYHQFIRDVGSLPHILSQSPPTIQIPHGSDVSFYVAAFGLNLTYQWKKDGNNVIGATNNFLVIDPPQLSDLGTYTCVVSNSVGSIVSAAIVFSFSFPPYEMVGEGGEGVLGEGGEAPFAG